MTENPKDLIIKNIRNFSIVAHIDHGKSTLADRMLELTNTVEKRKMQDQVLDRMELERERGITIKMQPVRMKYAGYILNLIDTPGHIDFSYEVSRALKAVEGVILLVDATQGVQAQTLTTLEMAKNLSLPIIPVINKVDLPNANVKETEEEITKIIDCGRENILKVSAKTGEGVRELLDEIIKSIPEPKVHNDESSKALIFDFEYSSHKGVIVYIRVFSGSFSGGDELYFVGGRKSFSALEVGIFSPDKISSNELSDGEIGYIVTGIKEPGLTQVGDTVTFAKKRAEAIPGYQKPKPVVWASVYPLSQDDFEILRLSLGKLQLSDSSISFEEETSGSLGRGFRCGFLGMLHLEIITERLRREFGLELVLASPTITYEITHKDSRQEIVYTPYKFPDDGSYEIAREPWVTVMIITPSKYLGGIMQLLYDHEAETQDTTTFGDNRTSITVSMPLRELMRNFFDNIKSISSGFASLSYEIGEFRDAHVGRIDILIAGEVVPAFSRVVSLRRIQKESSEMVKNLKDVLPRQQFVVKIQAKAGGRIIASKTLSAFRKDVTAKLYGGDITRKMKLREKQKKGKKKMKEAGKITIPQDVFLKMMRK